MAGAKPRAWLVHKIEDVINRGAIVEVAENEPLTEAKLAPLGSGGGLPPTIPEGMRAISVKTNEVVGVAGFVIPGHARGRPRDRREQRRPGRDRSREPS